MTERDEAPVGATFDAVTKAFARGTVSRRRGLLALGASLVGGALGSLTFTDDAEGKKNKKRRNRNRNRTTTTQPPATTTTQPPATTTTPPPGTTTTPPPPNASQNCLAANNQCGTFAAQQGQCRLPAAADNQAGFLCTSNQAGNICTASTQCGAGTRCVQQGAALNCRVVIQ